MHTCISRCLAEQDLRSLQVATNSQSEDGAKTIRDRLVLELGDVGTHEDKSQAIDAKRDEEGFEFLKLMSRG